jgi:hypothetical protein
VPRHHQKLHLSEAASSEVISPEAEDQLNLQNSRIQELFHGSKFIKGQQKTSGMLQRSFQKCLKAFASNLDKSFDIVLCTNCTTTFSTTLQDKKTTPEYGFACKDVPLDKEWISNWFFI